MNNFKKFLGNKNTVTILGVIICLVVLYVGYNMRINSKVQLTSVPYANVDIQPRTLITSDVISRMSVPQSFLVGKYYTNENDIIGKYSNYNTMIAQGSLFYVSLLTDEKNLPDSAFIDVPDNYTVINYPVTIASTYANSMYPGNYINIYFKAINDKDEIMFGKFISNVEILDVKDSAGQHVFENTEEARTPAFMLFAVPEEIHLLIRKALYLTDNDVELILVPNTTELDEKADVYVSSKDIEEFIASKTVLVDVTDLPKIEDTTPTTGTGKTDTTGTDTTKTN